MVVVSDSHHGGGTAFLPPQTFQLDDGCPFEIFSFLSIFSLILLTFSNFLLLPKSLLAY